MSPDHSNITGDMIMVTVNVSFVLWCRITAPFLLFRDKDKEDRRDNVSVRNSLQGWTELTPFPGGKKSPLSHTFCT